MDRCTRNTREVVRIFAIGVGTSCLLPVDVSRETYLFGVLRAGLVEAVGAEEGGGVRPGSGLVGSRRREG